MQSSTFPCTRNPPPNLSLCLFSWLQLLPRCLECSNNEAQCQALVNVLPTESYNVFVYVTSFLRELLAHSHTNNLSADRLSVVFASVLLREVRSRLVPA